MLGVLPLPDIPSTHGAAGHLFHQEHPTPPAFQGHEDGQVAGRHSVCLCWAPFTPLMIIRAACRGRCIEHRWYEVTFWLLWLNSAIKTLSCIHSATAAPQGLRQDPVSQ